MNSDAVTRDGSRLARHSLAVCCAVLCGLAAAPQAAEPTWRTVTQLTADERAQFDPDTSAPRDATLPYMPAEAYPFQPPYTAEEMGYRAAEFVHISRWPHSLIDVFGVITSSGYINQGAGVSYVNLQTKPGLEGYVSGVAAGQVYSRWSIYSVFPPETEAEQQLWVPYRTDAKNRTKMDFFVYSPQLRRVRRQPQPRRDQRFPDNAQTFDDVIGRDPWEFDWQLLGTDVVQQTIRFPNTRPTITLNNHESGFVERKTTDIRPMGDDYPHYRPDGGVDCWVVKAVTREDLLPDYNEKTLIYWLDKHYFYPVRMEKYDHEGKLIMIEVRNAALENPAREGFGYSALMTLYWDLEHDIMSYSVHDAHRPHEWTAEEQAMIFTPEFMRRQWLYEPIKSQALIGDPKHYFLRPQLYRERFPDERRIELSPALAARYEAQEAAGQLVFESGDDAAAPAP